MTGGLWSASTGWCTDPVASEIIATQSIFRPLRGQVECELKEPFATLADGAEEEERMIAENLPKIAINKNWLPGLDVLRTIPPEFPRAPARR